MQYTWQKLITKFSFSKSNQSAFCREHDLNYQTFRYWLKKLAINEDLTESAFLPTVIETKTQDLRITVRISDIEIELQQGFDQKLFEEIIATSRRIS